MVLLHPSIRELAHIRRLDGIIGGLAAAAPPRGSSLPIATHNSSGMSNQDIAGRLHISPRTVGNHITSIFSKLQVSDRAQAIVKARSAGFGQ